MLGYALDLYAFQLGYCQRMLADIADADLTVQPLPALNHPAWLVGHLTVASDMALQLLGKESIVSPNWRLLCGPGSRPESVRERYPGKDELLSKLSEVHFAVTVAAQHVSSELLAQPNPAPFEFLRRALPLTGQLLQHLLTTHEALHLGQLATWRRALG